MYAIMEKKVEHGMETGLIGCNIGVIVGNKRMCYVGTPWI